MNTTFYTRQEIDQRYGDQKNLGEVFNQIEEQFRRQGEVVCQFRINGLKLSEADEKRLAQIHLDEIHTLEIDSQKPTDLLFELMANWIRELPTLIENTDQLSQAIRFQGMEGHLRSFVDLIESCQFLIDSLISLESVVKSPKMRSNEWLDNEALTARAIGEALSAFEKKDFVLIAEILEYDLGHSLQTWHRLLRDVEQQLKEENARDRETFDKNIFKRTKSGDSASDPSC